jgi:hypothetical protein
VLKPSDKAWTVSSGAVLVNRELVNVAAFELERIAELELNANEASGAVVVGLMFGLRRKTL